MGKSNSDNPFKGKRYIALVRASDDTQGDSSTRAQLDWMHAEGSKLEMQHTADLVLSGVTGSLPGRREDLEELLRRRTEKRDFDIVLVQRCDRLSRGGGDHTLWFIFEAKMRGLIVHFAGDEIPLPGTPFRNTMIAMKGDAAQDQAKAISQRSTQGWMYSISQGFNCSVSRTPFGCDRLYLSADRKPQFIIRNLGDGRQQKLHCETGEILETYGQIGGGNKGHYDKQKCERVIIVPGAPERMECVRTIFDLHYNRRWGGKRIADYLNERGSLSPTGKDWGQTKVESIYHNPIYCGRALGRRSAQGIYYQFGEISPENVHLDDETMTKSYSSPHRLRPPSDWRWEKHPPMETFLSSDLATKALPKIEKRFLEQWERSQDPTRKLPSVNKHKESDYILTDFLFAKQDGEPLTGVLCGKVGKKIRKYRHRRGNRCYRKKSIFNNYIRASELEEAVFALITDIIADTPGLRQQVIQNIRANAPTADLEQKLAALREEREKLAKRVRLIMKILSEEHMVDAKPEMDAIGLQRFELERQIGELENRTQFADENPESIADRVVEKVTSRAFKISELSASAKRDLLEAFVERLEVDMATKDVEVFLQLSDWAFSREFEGRVAPSSPSQTDGDTPHRLVIRLGIADCKYKRLQRDVCYTCRRRAA